MNTFKLSPFSCLGISFLLLSLYACSISNEKSVDSHSSVVDNAFRSYKIDLDAPKKGLAEVIDRATFIRLEETDQSLLKSVNHARIFNDLIVVPSFYSDYKLYFFDRNGKYLSVIDRKGKGPEEYQSFSDFWISGDTVKLHDSYAAKVYSYTKEGKFLGIMELPFRGIHMLQDGGGYWLDRSDQVNPNSTNYEVVGLNSDLEITQQFKAFEKRLSMKISTPLNTFRRNGDLLTYRRILSDTVYSIEPDTLRPWVHINLGEDYFWSDEEVRYDEQKRQALMIPSGKVWYMEPLIGKNFIHLILSGSRFESSPSFLINRQTGKMINLDKRISSDKFFGLSFLSWGKADQLLVGINSSDVSILMEQLDSSQITFAQGTSLEEIESSENPALMWVTFKDF